MTADVFGKQFPPYTIVDAIRDHNVLPFRVAYIRTIKEKKAWRTVTCGTSSARKPSKTLAAYTT